MGEAGKPPTIRQNCPQCGVRYSLPESAAGKRAKCKQCGEVFTVGQAAPKPKPAPPPKPKPEEGVGIFALADEVEEAARRAAEDADAIRRGQEEAWDDEPGLSGYRAGAKAEPTRGKRSYMGNVLWSFLFLANPRDLALFIGLWVVLGFLSALPVFGIFALIRFFIVEGYYAVFRLQVIDSAAAGDDDLPSPTSDGNWFFEFFGGLIKMLGSWVVVGLPALVLFLTVWSTQGLNALGDFDSSAGWGGLDLAPLGALVVGLGFLGIFLWPIIILCISLGGFSTLARPDLIVRTVVQSFHGYVPTVVLVYASLIGYGVLYELLESSTVPWILAGMLGFALRLYLDIVAMRCIGLYYHHFKHRFAWSWG